MANNAINGDRFLKIIVVFLLIIIILTFIPMINSGVRFATEQEAITFLSGRGYIVLAANEYDNLYSDVHSIFLNISNETFIFPEETNASITLTAGAIANTFGAWTEIVDSNAVTLSSKFVAKSGILAEINTEDYSVNHERYMVEIAYGDSKEVIARTRVKSEQLGITPFVYYLDLKSKAIPAGETVYYRLKAETALATLECSFRYYYP